MTPSPEKLMQIVARHGKWLRGEEGGECAHLRDAYLAHADLAGAYLRRANLGDANLAGANLAGADLDGAYLRGAYLRRANLGDANLAGANLAGAYLRGANLRGANLACANLAGADLACANLAGANLRGANLRGANLAGANLAGVRGNMREVKTAQIDRWPVAWTQPEGGEIILQIGCQRHPLSLWIKSDPRWIAALDPGATEWWGRWRDTVLRLVEMAPPVPFAMHKEDEA